VLGVAEFNKEMRSEILEMDDGHVSQRRRKKVRRGVLQKSTLMAAKQPTNRKVERTGAKSEADCQGKRAHSCLGACHIHTRRRDCSRFTAMVTVRDGDGVAS
jgi:hypothetical protein